MRVAHKFKTQKSKLKNHFLLEHSVQRRIYLVRNFSECLRIRLELLGVAVHYYQLSLIVLNPFLISFVQTCEIVDAYGLLALTSSLANLIHRFDTVERMYIIRSGSFTRVIIVSKRSE